MPLSYSGSKILVRVRGLAIVGVTEVVAQTAEGPVDGLGMAFVLQGILRAGGIPGSVPIRDDT